MRSSRCLDPTSPPGGGFTAPSGFPDFDAAETAARTAAIAAASAVVERYGFVRVETPLVERREVFDRLGAASDVVAKEMFALGDDLVIRPEGTAGVARAFGGNGRRRLYYCGPMMRAERPQSNRFRQFTQLGCEDLDATSAASTAEVVLAAVDAVAATGAAAQLRIGSVGCGTCRPGAIDALRAWAATAALCDDCTRRAETSPLRMLDCRDGRCDASAGTAPAPLGSLCVECRDELRFVTEVLEAAGVDVVVDAALVRGLDYYRSVTFELVAGGIAVAGGGRYDRLGAAAGGVGFALGVERCLASTRPAPRSRDGLGLVAVPGVEAGVLAVARRIRARGERVFVEAEGRSVRAALRQLERVGAAASAVLGPAELDGTAPVLVRDLDTGAERTVALGDL